jgi:hypothetical protein
MCVDAVMSLDQDLLDPRMIGVKKVMGGSMRDSFLVVGALHKLNPVGPQPEQNSLHRTVYTERLHRTVYTERFTQNGLHHLKNHLVSPSTLAPMT